MSSSENFACRIMGEVANGVVLDCQKAGRLVVARRFLPKDIKQGQEIFIKFQSKQELEMSSKQLAQALLDEIMMDQKSDVGDQKSEDN